jgi:hypothetical protein
MSGKGSRKTKTRYEVMKEDFNDKVDSKIDSARRILKGEHKEIVEALDELDTRITQTDQTPILNRIHQSIPEVKESLIKKLDESKSEIQNNILYEPPRFRLEERLINKVPDTVALLDDLFYYVTKLDNIYRNLSYSPVKTVLVYGHYMDGISPPRVTPHDCIREFTDNLRNQFPDSEMPDQESLEVWLGEMLGQGRAITTLVSLGCYAKDPQTGKNMVFLCPDRIEEAAQSIYMLVDLLRQAEKAKTYSGFIRNLKYPSSKDKEYIRDLYLIVLVHEHAHAITARLSGYQSKLTTQKADIPQIINEGAAQWITYKILEKYAPETLEAFHAQASILPAGYRFYRYFEHLYETQGKNKLLALLFNWTYNGDQYKWEQIYTEGLSYANQIIESKNLTIDEQMNSRNVDTRRNAVQSIEKNPLEEHVPLLLDALEDSDIIVKTHACFALGQLQDESTITDLVAMLNDQHENVTGSAAWALGEIGDPEALPELKERYRKALDESEYYVEKRTIEAIRKIQNA